MKFKCVAFIFAMLWLVACSGGPDEIVARYNSDGHKFSPTMLKGSVEYLLYIEPEKVMVVPVDYQLNALDSFEVTEHHINLCYYNFGVASREYDVPFVKIVAFFPTSNDKLMEFFPTIDKNKHMYSAFIIGYPKRRFRRTIPHKDIKVKFM